jgi:Xrn1 helical domain
MHLGYLVSLIVDEFGSVLTPGNVDLRAVDEMAFEFDLGIPFKPFEQLMGVLPEASKEHIPLAFQVCRLMLLFFLVVNAVDRT